jgi:thiol-disulfide isomerase/thioredoxin
MQLQKVDQILLVIALFLVGLSFYQKQSDTIVPDNPNNPVVIPTPNKPILKENIFYDEYDKAKKISIDYNKKLVLVFGADWCPYCKDLKKDINKIQEFKKYIVCFINTDNNKSLVQEYKIKSLPTSIIISNNTEEARKSGYKYNDYCEWLQNNNHGEKTWSDLPL